VAMSHAQGMAYELARELISSQIGHLSNDIAAASCRPVPDREQISIMEAQIVRLGAEREHLNPEDDLSVRDVIRRYSLAPDLVMLLLDSVSPDER